MSFATGLITNTIPCWLISVKNRSPSSENVMCLATQQSRDLVLANHNRYLGGFSGIGDPTLMFLNCIRDPQQLQPTMDRMQALAAAQKKK
jgi:hypothetical protein